MTRSKPVGTKQKAKKPKTKAKVTVAKKSRKRQQKPKKIPAFGRPLKFQTVKELQKAIDDYFDSLYEPAFDMWGNPIINKKTGEQQKKKVLVATVTGLAVALDTTRDILLSYENGKHDGKDLTIEQLAENEQIDDFSNTIKKAKLKIYADTEQQLYKGKPTGAIFSLKNNYGWVDKVINETTSQEPKNPYEGLTEDELRKLANG